MALYWPSCKMFDFKKSRKREIYGTAKEDNLLLEYPEITAGDTWLHDISKYGCRSSLKYLQDQTFTLVDMCYTGEFGNLVCIQYTTSKKHPNPLSTYQKFRMKLGIIQKTPNWSCITWLFLVKFNATVNPHILTVSFGAVFHLEFTHYGGTI